MSYDFWLEVPKTQITTAIPAEQRIKHDLEIMQAFEPGIEIEEYEDVFVANSTQFGPVTFQGNRICLNFYSSTPPILIYTVIHELWGCFHNENYIGVDPQIDQDLVFHEKFLDFMRQYQSQFTCTDEEFVAWCAQDITPQA